MYELSEFQTHTAGLEAKLHKWRRSQRDWRKISHNDQMMQKKQKKKVS